MIRSSTRAQPLRTGVKSFLMLKVLRISSGDFPARSKAQETK